MTDSTNDFGIPMARPSMLPTPAKMEADRVPRLSIKMLKKQTRGLLPTHRSGRVVWINGYMLEPRDRVIFDVEFEYQTDEDSMWGNASIKSVKKQFIHQGQWKLQDYKIEEELELVSSECNFGSRRLWFSCPFRGEGAEPCERRTDVLYLVDGKFGCRECHNLTYMSRNLSGVHKKHGRMLSGPERSELEKEVKRPLYAGKPTKKFDRYIRAELQSEAALISKMDGVARSINRVNKRLGRKHGLSRRHR